MGIDAFIGFTTTDGKIPDLEKREQMWQSPTPLPAETKIVFSGCFDNAVNHYKIENMYRYYDKEYPRGNWPEICSILMILFAHPKINKVIYGEDFGACDEIDIDDVLVISRHYMQTRAGNTESKPIPKSLTEEEILFKTEFDSLSEHDKTIFVDKLEKQSGIRRGKE